MAARICYLRISPERLRLTMLKQPRCFEDVPVIAVAAKAPGTIIAFGKAAERLAKKADVSIHRPFSHPRLIVHELASAQKIFQHAARELLRSLPLLQRLGPISKLIVHPLRVMEAGLSDLERRALLELGYGIGAGTVSLHLGRELNSAEVAGFDFRTAKPGRVKTRHIHSANGAMAGLDPPYTRGRALPGFRMPFGSNWPFS